MADSAGQRLRDLDEIDQRLKELDYEVGDWLRRQTARIREAREAVANLKAKAKHEMKGDKPPR